MKQFNNITNPKHYQGKYGMEAVDVVRNFIWDLNSVQAYFWGERCQISTAFPKEERSRGFEESSPESRLVD